MAERVPAQTNDGDRYEHEREFWDARIATVLDDPTYEYRNGKLGDFAALAHDIEYLRPVAEFFGDLRGKSVLDLACGDGWIALALGKSGARVHGCDISPMQIEFARRMARANGLEDRVLFDVMVVEEVSYADETFDAVIMHAALHHCDIERTVEQVRRVLKPGGKAVFVEDYAYHPVMNLYRRLTPHGHTETEEALTNDDLQRVGRRFRRFELRFHGIVNLVETKRSRWARLLRPTLRKMDAVLYSVFPPARRLSRLVTILVAK